jgi:hypothetical protein
MANIPEPANPAFPAVYQWDLEDDVVGGPDGMATYPVKQLTERTAYLKKNLEKEVGDREEADSDLQDQIDTNAGKINAVKGRGGYLMAYDFGTHTPTQGDLNAYALSEIHSDDPLDIWNGTHVKNIYVDPATIDEDHPDGVPDNHVWALTNTPDTEPPIHEWVDDGFDSVSEFSNEFAGVLQGMEDPGDGTKDGFITAIGKYAKIIGEIAYKNFMYQIGDYYEQYPDAKTPVERGLPGTWEIWSHRPIMYGITQLSPPSSVDYYTLVGTSIAAGATPVVCYHKAGNDWRLYKFISQTAAYTVPEELDPVKWTYQAPGSIVERQKCGNALTDADYTIKQQIASGTYAGYYVTEIIVPGGKFSGVEGGFRPPFVSGGVQEDRIRNLTGSIPIKAPGYEFIPMDVTGANGIFVAGTGSSTRATVGDSVSHYPPTSLSVNAGRVVKTGSDVAPQNLSTRLWRRVA